MATMKSQPTVQTVDALGQSEPPKARSIEATEWAQDNIGRHDVALMGAFVYTMRQRQKFAAPAADFDAAFDEFKNEVAE
jgi:hypothetical protein